MDNKSRKKPLIQAITSPESKDEFWLGVLIILIILIWIPFLFWTIGLI